MGSKTMSMTNTLARPEPPRFRQLAKPMSKKSKRSVPVYNTPIIETHFHLDYLKDESAEEILESARAVGVERFITISVEPGNMPTALSLADQYEDVFATLGVHPHEAEQFQDQTIDFMQRHLPSKRVVAVGEIGLDYYYDHCDRSIQINAFTKQLELATQLNLPVVIHTREADEDTLAILNEFAPDMHRKGVIHSFTSGLELAERAVELGFCLGINGIVTFNKADNVREVVHQTPLEHLLLETDAPYLTPVPYRGKENAPKYLPFVAEKIAEVKQCDVQQVLQATYRNSIRTFFDE